MDDIMNLTKQKLEDWRVRYYKSTDDHELTEEALKAIIPLTPEKYSAKYDKEEEVNDIDAHKDQEELDALKTAAGVNVDTVAPKNEYTESLRVAAGIK